ncbi:GntR family transcriptional regulator, partial [Pseudomonas aeruginosa]
LGDLQKEGLIFKIHGKGTFVARPKAFQNVSTLQGLGESMTQMGYEVINRLHGLRYVPAGARVAERLRVEEGSPVCEIKRVRLVNREPVSLEVTYLPQALG